MAPGIGVLLGPFLVGALILYLLLGGYLVQLFYYLTNDTIATARTQLHIVVALVTAAFVTNVVFVSLNAWRDLVLGIENPALRLIAPVTAPATSALNGITACLVQCFFAWRITRLARKRYRCIRYTIPATIVSLALLHMSAGFAVSARFVEIGRQADFLGRLRLSITLYLSAGLACDTLITISMIFILLDFKAQTDLSTTKRLLNSLIFHAVENGAVTTLCAALNLAFYITRPQDNIHVAFQFVIGGLYANVLLAALNGRGRTRSADTSTGGSSSLREEEAAGFRDLDVGTESESRAVSFSTQRSSALYRLTAPTKKVLRTHCAGSDSDGLNGGGGGILGFKKRKGRKKEGEQKVPSPPKAFLVSRVTEVHRDEDLVRLGRRKSGGTSASETSERASTSDTHG